MRVKVTWRNKNPFCPDISQLGRISEAEIDDATEYSEIEKLAKEATPANFFLKSIKIDHTEILYDKDGNITKK